MYINLWHLCSFFWKQMHANNPQTQRCHGTTSTAVRLPTGSCGSVTCCRFGWWNISLMTWPSHVKTWTWCKKKRVERAGRGVAGRHRHTHSHTTHSMYPTHPSTWGQSKLGPRTMAMLLGVILFTACCSDNSDRNWTRYLTERKQKGQFFLVHVVPLIYYCLSAHSATPASSISKTDSHRQPT